MFWKKNPPPPAPNPIPEAERPAPEAARSGNPGESSTPSTPNTPSAPSTPGVPSEVSAPSEGSAAPTSPAAAASPATSMGTGLLREEIIGQLRTVYDPEIPVNIYELGLVYKVDVDEQRNVLIEMTLTSPACPSAEEIPVDVRRKVEALEGVKSVEVRIVWDPPWTQEFMSEAARVQLGFF